MGTKHLKAAQRLAADTLVDLYTLDISARGGPMMRWTPGPLGGVSQNHLVNHSFRQNTSGWTFANAPAAGPASSYGAAYWPPNQGAGYLSKAGNLAAGSISARSSTSGAQTGTPVVAGSWWEAQARVAPIRSKVRVALVFTNSAGTPILTVNASDTPENAGDPGNTQSLDSFTLSFARGQAPAGAVGASLLLTVFAATGGSTNSAVIFTMGQVAQVPGPGGPHPWSEPTAAGSPREVIFAGQTYVPFPLLIESVSWTVRGAMPRPRVTVPDVDSYFTQLLLAYDNLLGCPVTRLRVFAANLDGGPDPDATSYFGPETWYVDQIPRHKPGEVVSIDLDNPLNLQGKMIPGRQVIRDTCTHVYRRWNGSGFTGGSCPYAGGGYWKADGTATALPAEDACGKRLSDCKLRFANAPLQTRAFPGVSKYRS